MQLGPNTFQVTAHGTDGSQASASWTLHGTAVSTPDGGTTLVLFGAALGLLSFMKKKMR
jgi:hypothetical protein